MPINTRTMNSQNELAVILVDYITTDVIKIEQSTPAEAGTEASLIQQVMQSVKQSDSPRRTAFLLSLAVSTAIATIIQETQK